MKNEGCQTFWHLLQERAERGAKHPAILQGERVFSFGDWYRLSHRYAHWFNLQGGTRGDRVLIWMNSSPEMAAAMLGVWACGGIFALMDPRAKADHFLHALRTITPRFVFASDEASLPAEPLVPVLFPNDLAAGSEEPLKPVDALPVDPASIVFTSGSTGLPKGVTQSHGNLLRGCRAVTGYLGLDDSDRILCTVPWSFDYGYGQLLSTIMTAATHVLPTAPNPFGLCEAIERHRPTVLAGVPSVFTYLLRGVSPIRSADLSSVKTLTNTGGSIPAPILQDLRELFPGRRVFLNYGLTETYRTSYLDPSLIDTNSTSIGRAIPGVGVVIVRDDGAVADVGEIGEVVHRGDYVCLGYWNDPEATARSVRPDPLSVAGCPRPAMALYTGDLGRIDSDGLLYFCGRRDRQLKPMGVRVNPGETEDALHKSGLVREVAVLGKKHELIGDELWALVVPVDGNADPADVIRQLKDYSREALSPFMIPQRFVVKDALPKTTSGKIDYPRLTMEIGARR